MPRDLLPDPDLIVVHDRAGTRLPFSRGIMATSLLPTGVTTPEAHRLASLLHDELRRDGHREIESEELVERASEVLAAHAGRDVAERWLAWQRAKRVGLPLVVSLCGAPGVGKSTIATRLAVRLEITRIVTTDTIREVLRTVVPATVLAELHASTYEVVDLDAAVPFAGFDRQSDAVAAAITAVASRLATEQRSLIVEGVHLRPGRLRSDLDDHPARPVVLERLLIEPDAEMHRQRLLHRGGAEPLRRGARTMDSFGTIRAIQEYLIEHAERAGVPLIDAGGLADLTQTIVDDIVRHTG